MQVSPERAAYNTLRALAHMSAKWGTPPEGEVLAQFKQLWAARNVHLLAEVEKAFEGRHRDGYPRSPLDPTRSPARPFIEYPDGTDYFNLWRDKELGWKPPGRWHYLNSPPS